MRKNVSKPIKRKFKGFNGCIADDVESAENSGYNEACNEWEVFHNKIIDEKDKEIADYKYWRKTAVKYGDKLEKILEAKNYEDDGKYIPELANLLSSKNVFSVGNNDSFLGSVEMDLEKQVVSLELSKKLKELGVKQDSLFYWGIDETGENIVTYSPSRHKHVSRNSAFTVAELGKILEDYVGNIYWEDKKHWKVSYNGKNYEIVKTEADARAKMLIWLIGNNCVDVL